MKVVRITGPVQKLNETLMRILSVDYIAIENTIDILTRDEGYNQASSPSPFTAVINSIEETAKSAGDPIDGAKLTNVFGTGKKATETYCQTLMKYLQETDFDNSDINLFISGLKPKIDDFIEKSAKYSDRQRYLKHRLDNLNHFDNLDVNVNSIAASMKEMSANGRTGLHFGYLPKSSMVKLYYFNKENNYIFRTLSSDEDNYWGIFASTDTEENTKKVFETLFFEELDIDGDINNIKKNIADTQTELDSLNGKINELNSFWAKNSEILKSDCSILLDLDKIWSFRSYAAVKNDSFNLIGWVPKKNSDDAKSLLGKVQLIEFTIKDPEKSMTVNTASDPFPYESSVRDIEHLSHQADVELSSDKLFNILGTSRKPTKQYLDFLSAYLSGDDVPNGVPSGLRQKIADESRFRKDLKLKEANLKKTIRRLKHFESLDTDLGELLSMEFVEVRFGRLPKKTLEDVNQTLDKEHIAFSVCDSDDRNAWVVYAAPNVYALQADLYFEDHYFKNYHFDAQSGTVKEVIEKDSRELEKIAAEKNDIVSFWKSNERDILLSYSILTDLRTLWSERHEVNLVNGKLMTKKRMSKREKAETEVLLKAFGGFEGMESGDHTKKGSLVTPTKLRNNPLTRPYEYFVNMYGVPSYGSIDITSFMAISYTVLFGIMFGDLGQGLVLLIAGLYLWKKKRSGLGHILIPCGCASMVAGFVFGSVFGYEHMLDPVYKAIGMSGKPVSVMDSINGVLIFAIFTGVALMIVSMLVNIYANLKEKKIGAALFSTNGVAGVILYLCGVELVYGFMSGTKLLPTSVVAPVMAVTAVILYIQEILIGIVDKVPNWKPDSWGNYFMQAFFELFEVILSYFSNTVSFLRVGAFVLVHAGMMMVVFSLAGASENIIVIILGNILVIFLEGLLSGIQALRLEYYEMFSRCYSGNGKKFVPASELAAAKN